MGPAPHLSNVLQEWFLISFKRDTLRPLQLFAGLDPLVLQRWQASRKDGFSCVGGGGRSCVTSVHTQNPRSARARVVRGAEWSMTSELQRAGSLNLRPPELKQTFLRSSKQLIWKLKVQVSLPHKCWYSPTKTTMKFKRGCFKGKNKAAKSLSLL